MVELGMRFRPMMEEPISDSDDDTIDLFKEGYMRRRRRAGLGPEVPDETSLILK